jgi:hypothetical protein
MTRDILTLLDASAHLAAGATRIAQVLEHGTPDAWQAKRLLAARVALREAQLAVSDALGCRPGSATRETDVRA